MDKFNKLSPKVKQKLMGIFEIISGFSFAKIMPDEYGWGIILIIIGIFFLLTKKQYLEFD